MPEPSATRRVPATVLWAAGGVLLVIAVVLTAVFVLDDSTSNTVHDGAHLVASALFPVLAVGAAFSAVDSFREGRGPNPLGAPMLVVAGLCAIAAAGVSAAVDDDGSGSARAASDKPVDPSRLGISQRQNACSQIGFGALPPLPSRYVYTTIAVPAVFRGAADAGDGVVARAIKEGDRTVARLVSVALGPQTRPNQQFLLQVAQSFRRQRVTLSYLGLKPFGALIGDLPEKAGSIVVAHGSCRAYYLAAPSPPSALGMAKVVLDADDALKQRVAQNLTTGKGKQGG